MALSPSLLTTLKYDGFRCPVPAGTTFLAGDVVPIGTSLVGIAATDYNVLGSTGMVNSVNLVGIYTMPTTGGSIAAGAKVLWRADDSKVAPSTAGATTVYPLGIAAAASVTGASSGTVDVLLWPGSGIGS